MAATATVHIKLADVPQVRAVIDQATDTIRALQDAVIIERIGWQVGPGLMGMDKPTFSALWESTREQLRAEGLPMGAADGPSTSVPT